MIVSFDMLCSIRCKRSIRATGIFWRCSIILCIRFLSHMSGTSFNCILDDMRGRSRVLINVRMLASIENIWEIITPIIGTTWLHLNRKNLVKEVPVMISTTFLKYMLLGLFCASISIPNAQLPRRSKRRVVTNPIAFYKVFFFLSVQTTSKHSLEQHRLTDNIHCQPFVVRKDVKFITTCGMIR